VVLDGALIIAFISSFHMSRLTEPNLNRSLQYLDQIALVSKVTKVPSWVIVGIAFNESNMTIPPKRDVIGMTQISCRVWLGKLREWKVVNKCDDLLKPSLSFLATAKIVRFIKSHKRYNTWPKALTAYRWGSLKKGVDYGYYQRVYWFGKNITSFDMKRAVPLCKE
jgi:hypothetical protein